MDVTPEVCNQNAWASLRTASKAQLLALQHYFDRRNLEGSLAALTESARGHQSQGRPPGSAVYVVLNREALLLVTAYANHWGTDVERLYAELPSLNLLRQLAQPKPSSGPLFIAVLIVIAVIGSAFALGLAGAFVRVGYQMLGGVR